MQCKALWRPQGLSEVLYKCRLFTILPLLTCLSHFLHSLAPQNTPSILTTLPLLDLTVYLTGHVSPSLVSNFTHNSLSIFLFFCYLSLLYTQPPTYTSFSLPTSNFSLSSFLCPEDIGNTFLAVSLSSTAVLSQSSLPQTDRYFRHSKQKHVWLWFYLLCFTFLLLHIF